MEELETGKSSPIELLKYLLSRLINAASDFDNALEIITFDDWVDRIYKASIDNDTATEEDLSQKWLITYCEYLCQKRRVNAPIDEPCLNWVTSLSKILTDIPHQTDL